MASIVIGPWQLALATLFVVFVGVVSIRLSLGITKDLAIATVRTYVQLLVLGYVLRYVFAIDSPWLVVGLLLLMVLMAARIIVQRSPDAPPGIFASAFVSMALTGFIVTFAVTGVIVQVEPWYLPQYVIPLAGMVIGNSMTGIALALERVFADLDSRKEEVLALTALGRDAVGGVARRDPPRAARRPHPHHQLDGRRRHRLHPGHDVGPDPGRRRPGHRHRLPDRRDADGRCGHRAGQRRRAAAHVQAQVHEGRHLPREGLPRRRELSRLHPRSVLASAAHPHRTRRSAAAIPRGGASSVSRYALGEAGEAW